MRTEPEIGQRKSRELLLFHVSAALCWGATIAFFADGFWTRGLIAGLVASIIGIVSTIRRGLLEREHRLAKLGLSD